jgi:hypothetical protein
MKPKNMLLTQTVIKESPNSTVSKLECSDIFLGFVIEDGHRPVKIPGETRIPGGKYPLKPIQYGTHYERYSKRFGHDFAIAVTDVPNFSYIRYHIGNYVRDTEGCPLNNWGFYWDEKKQIFVGSRSTACYLNFYEFLKKGFDQNLEIWVDIRR